MPIPVIRLRNAKTFGARWIVYCLVAALLAWSALALAETGRDWVPATLNAPWFPRAGHATVQYGGSIWVIGGEGRLMRQPEVWKSSNGTIWTLTAPDPLWDSRIGHMSVVFNGRMWLIGGDVSATPGAAPRNDVWYSTNGTTWTRATAHAPWAPRMGHGSVVFNNKMWVFGGGTWSTAFYNDVWWSTNGTSWTCATPKAGFSPGKGRPCVVHNGRMWILGTGPDNYDKEVWCSSDGRNWTRVVANAPWRGQGGIEAIACAGKIWVMGGNQGSNDYFWTGNDVWCSADGVNWREVTRHAAWSGRGGFSLVVHNRRLWLLGGGVILNGPYDPPTYLNDVWYTDLPTDAEPAWKQYP